MTETSTTEYELSLFSSADTYILLTTDLNVIGVNAAHAELTGYPRNGVTGKWLFDAFPVKSARVRNRVRLSFKRVVKYHTTDTVHVHPAADYRDSCEGWYGRIIINTPLCNADGQLAFILSHVTHERMRSASETDDSRMGVFPRAVNTPRGGRCRLHALMELAPGFVAVARGPHFVFELANKSFYQLVGHRDILGKSIREALPELEGQGFYELLARVYESGEAFIGRGMAVRFQQQQGGPLTERYVDFSYQPLFGRDNTVSGVFVQGQDVTEAHELSKQLSCCPIKPAMIL